MRTTYCRTCDKPLLNRRPQTTTCNAACRSKIWRRSRITMIPVSIMFNLTNYALVTKAASAAGVPVNDYVHDRAVQTMEVNQ